uniref:Uncharacterized protein n=1 Tax=Arundo donax TaxID=35708 RepID=A0A0A9A3L7_ARUDO
MKYNICITLSASILVHQYFEVHLKLYYVYSSILSIFMIQLSKHAFCVQPMLSSN